ncbi:HlyD family secretion protein [Sphingomonas flavalba]|uniref:HlyD family secretion protein n=1 Tax=Sphingomonas flavalba TaxID=2559804 RepID=UPI00109E0141|nr:HlyD family secretion protein [Sphingomonas flavalba]
MADADRPIIAAGEVEAPVEQVPRRRRVPRLALMLSLPLLLLAGGAYLWLTSGRYVGTDNAYVQQDKVSVSADVAGRIVAVAVRENQTVKAGDLLFRIDPDPYRIALEQANAALATAQVGVTSLQSSYRATQGDIIGARDAIKFAQEDYDRQAALMKRGFTTLARMQQAEHALQQANVQLRNAVDSAAEAQAKLATGSAVPGVNPQIAAAMAVRDKAKLDLERTEVRAPVPGQVSQSTRLQVGQMMISGLPAVSIVINGQSWVEANFKETELDNMRVGQPAVVKFDAFPGITLKGHVESIGAGTGSEFSVLPAQNANGNWVKVTQRIPVRIAIDGTPPRQLIAGQSAHVKVDTKPDGG